MDVELPDGTIVTGVPEGTTQTQLRAKLGKRAPPSKRGGASGDYGEPNEGLSFFDKVGLSMHDTDSERELYLKKRFGEKNVRREWGEGGKADFVVTDKDKSIYVNPRDLGFLAETAGQIPELGGMVAGASVGAEVGALGGPFAPITVPAGAIVGAGVGAMTGRGIKEVGKGAAGTYSKTPEQLKAAEIESGEQGMIGEAGGRVVGKVLSKALSGRVPGFITGATDESRAMTEKAWAGGARPPYSAMAPDARKLARIEVEAEKITGRYSKQDERNMQYVLSEMQNSLREAGIPQPQIDLLKAQLRNPEYEFSGREAGEKLQAAIRAQSEALDETVKTTTEGLDHLLNTRLGNVHKMIESHPPAALADDTGAMITNAKKYFTQTFEGLYKRIDDMTGGVPVVPVEPIREAARQITSQLPRTAVTAIVREMSQLGGKPLSEEDAILLKEFGIELPADANKLTLSQAQRARTILREKGDSAALTRNTVKGDHLYIARAFDDAISQAGEDPAAAAAVSALRRTDKAYGDGIAKFRDTTFKQLVKAARSKLPPDPQTVARVIVGAGQSARVTELRQVLGPAVWKRVQSADLQTILSRTSSVGADGKRVVDGMKLLQFLEKRGAVQDAVYDKATTADLQELGRSLAAKRGTLAPEALQNGDIRAAVTALRAQEKVRDDWMKKNMLSSLADPSKTGEEVYQWVVRPGEESRVMAVARQFGENSPQMTELRQAALEELARNARLDTITEKGTGALGRSLKAFTRKQQELLFPDGMAADIRKLGETIDFVFKAKGDVGMAGFEAGKVLDLPLRRRLYRQAVLGITRMIATHPSFARWIVTGRDPNTPWIHTSANIVKNLTRLGIMDTPIEVPEEQQQPQQPQGQQPSEARVAAQ